MSKFDLLANLEDGKSPKAKFQLFEVELNSEKTDVLIPFDKADEFMSEAKEQKPKSKAALKRLAVKFGGDLQ